MRVLIYAALPDEGTGGVQTFLAALIKSLGELTDGNEEYVLLASAGHQDWLRKMCGPNQRIETMDYVAAGLGRRACNRLARTWRKLLGRMPLFRHERFAAYEFPANLNPARLIPASTGYLESFGAAVIHFPYQWFIVSSLPSVFNPHDLQHLHLPQFFSPETLLWRDWFYPFACRAATKIAVVSEWTANDVCEQYAVPRRKLAVIPCGPAMEAQSVPSAADVAALRRQYALPQEYVFYPAAAWPHKNHRRLIEAAEILNKQGRPVSLVFSGLRTELTTALEQQVATAGLNGHVKFLGHVPSEHMRGLYRGARATVVPTLFEAISGPVAEAWQEGIPTGCSDIPRLREQTAGASLLFDPASPSAIAGVVEKLVRDEATRQTLIEAGRKRIAEFQWRTAALKYRELYREMAQYAGTAQEAAMPWRL